MPPERIFDELVSHARRLGVGVRVEPFSAKIIARRGGMCVLNGAPVIVMDAALPMTDRVGVVAAALAKLGVESMACAATRREMRIGQARIFS